MSRWLVLISLSTIVLAACSAAVVDVTPPEGGSTSASAAEPTASDSPPEDTAPAPTVAPTDTAPEEDTAPVDTGNPAADSAAGDDRCLPDGVRFRTSYWPQTDFCQYSIDFSEVLSGGPPPDGIPALDDPQFVSIADADAWLADVEPVISFEHEGDVRAYPLQILIWHEIVNDTVGGLPVSVTFCPLCNATIVFDRTVDGTVLDFGTSGNLRNSDLIMYDRQTQSWWQQFTGESIVGAYNGTRLTFLPAGIVSWADFKAEHPDGQVLSQDTGYGRSYGSNPYAGYDRIDSRPFLYAGELDGRLPPMARVAAIEVNPDTFVAFPFQTMEQV
ncbi:MAG: DUF3179 domain-containing (seleno)protein, partial [Anaerolineales bacterium]